MFKRHQHTTIRFWQRFNGTMQCSYCMVSVSRTLRPNHPKRATIDHIIPLSLGGSNRKDNLLLSCRGCNIHFEKLESKLVKQKNLFITIERSFRISL